MGEQKTIQEHIADGKQEINLHINSKCIKDNRRIYGDELDLKLKGFSFLRGFFHTAFNTVEMGVLDILEDRAIDEDTLNYVKDVFQHYRPIMVEYRKPSKEKRLVSENTDLKNKLERMEAMMAKLLEDKKE